MPKKQTELKGIEAESIEEIDSAADAYVGFRDHRMALLVKEVEAKKKLMDAMEKHKLTLYRFDDLIVEVSAAKKLKVKRASDGEESEDED